MPLEALVQLFGSGGNAAPRSPLQPHLFRRLARLWQCQEQHSVTLHGITYQSDTEFLHISSVHVVIAFTASQDYPDQVRGRVKFVVPGESLVLVKASASNSLCPTGYLTQDGCLRGGFYAYLRHAGLDSCLSRGLDGRLYAYLCGCRSICMFLDCKHIDLT